MYTWLAESKYVSYVLGPKHFRVVSFHTSYLRGNCTFVIYAEIIKERVHMKFVYL